MARTFKSLLGDDVVNTRTLLHEAIPITGTIVSGTYFSENIKTFSHGMFQSVYDYPFLSSSANHIFDITYGHSSIASASANTQNAKKLNDDGFSLRQSSRRIAQDVIRAAEGGTAVPSDIATERSDLRDECATKESEINALSTKASIIDYELPLII